MKEEQIEIKLPPRKPLFPDEMTTDQLNAELQKAFDSMQAGRVHSADEVDSILRREYGI